MKSIRGRITLRMTLTTMLALLITGITSIYLNYSSTLDLLEQNMKELASVAAQRVSHELNAYINVSYDTGSMMQLADESRSVEEKKEIMEQRAATHNFVGYNIVGADGISIFDGNDYSDREYYQRAMKGEAYVSQPLLSKVTGQFSIMVAAPLWKDGTPDTEVVGVVYFKPAETFLNDIVNSIHISKNGAAFMLNSDGINIADVNAENVENQINVIEDAKKDSSLSELASLCEKMTAGKQGFGEYSNGSKSMTLAYAPIPATDGWSIAVSAPLSDFTGSTVQSIIISAVLLLIAAVISVFIAIRLAVGISKPIGLCCERLELLAHGDLNSPVPQITAKDETGRLAASTETIVTSINGIIGDISWGMDELAKGNFTISSKNQELYQGDFSRILTSMKDLIIRMTDALLQVRTAAEQVSIGSDQVSAGAQELSQGATEQASSVEELAASITEISSGVNTTAQDAVAARDETNLAGEKMGVTMQEMQTLRDAMTDISHASGEIGKVIKTIEDIAFQTNILALNAAVEAARAGEAGKGFAVVADEVRNLATKSADASKGTAALIQNSVDSVNRGTKLADSTAVSIGEVAESAQRVAIMIDAISKAAQNQADGLNQVTQGIDQISSVVQTNSATAEESAASSEELSGQSQMLKDLVERFKLLDSNMTDEIN